MVILRWTVLRASSEATNTLSGCKRNGSFGESNYRGEGDAERAARVLLAQALRQAIRHRDANICNDPVLMLLGM
jgi:hypothetical protein